MRRRFGLTMLFIAHDLAVVKNVSDRLAVMYLGKLCEIGDADRVYERPAHPYTQALLASVPSIDAVPRPPALQGEVPSALRPPSGCRFQTRCPLATAVCQTEEPTMRQIGPDHFVACHHADVGPNPQQAVARGVLGADGSESGTDDTQIVR